MKSSFFFIYLYSVLRTTRTINQHENMARNLSMCGVEPMDEDAPECPVCFTTGVLSSLGGCSHKFCMSCAVKNSSVRECTWSFHYTEMVKKCPLCRAPYFQVTHDFNGAVYDVKKKFKIKGFPWVSSFCVGLAHNLRIKETKSEYVVFMPEYLNNMIDCRSTVYRIDAADDMRCSESKKLLDKLELDLPAWILLPEIYPKLVVAKHLERMINDGLIVCLPIAVSKLAADQQARIYPDDKIEEGGEMFTVVQCRFFDKLGRWVHRTTSPIESSSCTLFTPYVYAEVNFLGYSVPDWAIYSRGESL